MRSSADAVNNSSEERGTRRKRMRVTMMIAATLGALGIGALTPAAASPATGGTHDKFTRFTLAQHQVVAGPWSTAASTTKKKKPKKKQRYERSN
jgi:hypothetical protein